MARNYSRGGAAALLPCPAAPALSLFGSRFRGCPGAPWCSLAPARVVYTCPRGASLLAIFVSTGYDGSAV